MLHRHRLEVRMATDRDARSSLSELWGLILIVGGLCSIVFGPVLLLGWLLFHWLRRAHPGDPDRLLFVSMLVLGCAGYIYVFRSIYPLLWPEFIHIRTYARWELDAYWSLLKATWVVFLPFTPLVALFLHRTQPYTQAEALAQREAQERKTEQRQRKTAQKQVVDAPATVGDDLVLGALISGDLQAWQQGNWLTYPVHDLRQHAVAVGASGSGKSETLLRIAYLAALAYRWQVIYVDAKGEERTAARFLAAMDQAGYGRVPLFPQRAYAGWRGDGRALLNRLHAVQTFSEPYYADVAALVLNLALNAPGGPPRSSRELVQRLGLDAQRDLYHNHPDAYKVERLRAEDVKGVYTRYAGFFDALGDTLDGRWALEDVDAAYFLVQGTAFKREAQSLGRWLVEEIAHYVTERKPRDRQVLIIIDEFSALSLSTDAANLFERIRSFGAAVIVSSQSYAGLGPEAERLLGAATTILLHQCNDPERIGRRAGTVLRPDYSYQVDEQGRSGGRSGRWTRHGLIRT